MLKRGENILKSMQISFFLLHQIEKDNSHEVQIVSFSQVLRYVGLKFLEILFDHYDNFILTQTYDLCG
jgi:hypothetical protein